MLYRLIMKLVKPECSLWDHEVSGFWDTAIAGSSCRRAALARALGMEAAQARGFATIGILWDLAAFFDSIRIHRLVKLALDKGFPPKVLRLGMKVHQGFQGRSIHQPICAAKWNVHTGWLCQIGFVLQSRAL